MAAGDARSPELLGVIEGLADTLGADSPSLRREVLTAELIDVSLGETAPQAWDTYRSVLDDEQLQATMLPLMTRFDQLGNIAPDDPRVDELARQAGDLGPRMLELLPPELRDSPGDPQAAERMLTALQTELTPAQARCLALMFDHWRRWSS